MPFICTSREAIVTSPVATVSIASRISFAFSAAVREPSKATIAASPAGIDVVGTTSTVRSAFAAACSAARTMFELFGRMMASSASSDCTARSRSAVDGFIVWPPSTIEIGPTCRGEALEELAVAVARDDRDDARLRGRGVGHEREQPLFALLRLLVHVRDLDPVDRADPRADRERGAGIVGVHVHLDRARIADDEERIAELLELVFERVPVEVFALDQEDGAVAERRELLMNRLVAQVLLDRRRLGDRLAGHGCCDSAHELDEACAAGVDDAGVLQNLQLLRRARERILTAAHEVDAEALRSTGARARAPRPPRPARG